MRYLSLFSGIEAVSVAWEPLGFECVAVAEILPFQSSVLKHHFPDVPNLGDVTKIDVEAIKKLGKIDVVVFGSPCQDMSLAGKRLGLNAVKEDTNHSSRLFFEGVRIFKLAQEHCGARYMLWENVYGALVSQEGKDFGTVLETLVGTKFRDNGLVWGNEGVVSGPSGLCEWAVLDAQWFGVPQRRRRVFALLDTGDWRSRKPILLEADNMRKVARPHEEARKEDSIIFADSFDPNFKRKPIVYEQHMSDFRIKEVDVCPTITAGWGTGGNKVPFVQTFDRQGIAQYSDNTVASTVSARDWKSATDLITYAIAENIIDRQVHNGGNGEGVSKETCYTLNATGVHAIANKYQVRRLTPTETERLQGFPDGWTDIGNASIAKRYNALGRSMAVPVMAWIGKQIKGAEVELS
jgi:DNA (cytosine-5)-methyltransferase 1